MLRARYFPLGSSERTRGYRSKLKYRKLNLSTEKALFNGKDDQTLEQVSQGGCGNIHPRLFQNLMRKDFGQPALADSSLNRETR